MLLGLFRALAIAAGLLLGGCATSLKVPAETESHLASLRSQLRSQGAAMVGDGCVLAAEALGSYAREDVSQRYADKGLKVLAGNLSSLGIAVHSLESPFLCGGMGNAGSELRVARDEQSAPEPRETPVMHSDRLRRDARLATAYWQLLRTARQAPADTPYSSHKPRPLDIEPELVQALQRDSGNRYLVVAILGGTRVSGGRKFATTVTIGLLSFLLSGGTAVSVAKAESATVESLLVVDLQQSEILWNSVHLMAYDPFQYVAGGLVEGWAASHTQPILGAPPEANADQPPAQEGAKIPNVALAPEAAGGGIPRTKKGKAKAAAGSAAGKKAPAP